MPTTVRKVAELVQRHYPHTAFLDTPLPAGDPLGGYAAVRKMENVLGWKPQVSVAEGVDRYVKWLRSTPAAAPDWLRQAAAV